VDIERIALSLRPRNAWEALDLGFAMARQWWRPVFGAWCVVYFPVALLLAVAFAGHIQYAFLTLWWLKPVFDRIVLHVLGRAVFGETSTVRQALRAYPGVLRSSGLLLGLTLYRFDPTRSFSLPVWQLEQQRGYQARERRKLLRRRAGGFASWLTFVCANVQEMILPVAGMLAVMVFLPSETTPLHRTSDFFAWWGSGEQGWKQYLGAALDALAVSLIEPFYVSAGLALYLHRRSELEGWDIELAFRRLASRKRIPAARRGAQLAGVLLAGTLSLLCCANGTGHAADDAPAPSAAELSKVKTAVEETLKAPEFGTVERQSYWKYIGKDTEKKKSTPRGTRWLESFGLALAQLLRVLAWVMAAVALAVILYWIVRRIEWDRSRVETYRPPDTLFGLDVRPTSLPRELAAAARDRARAGDLRGALSLLYRGALSVFLHRDRVEFRRGDTEGDCVRKVARATEPATVSYFSALVRAWEHIAYAKVPAAQDSVLALCDQWDAHFRAPAPEAKP
jgi:hypothetical protein